MSDGIHADLDAIQNIQVVCDRFADTVATGHQSVESELLRISEALADKADDLQREISDLRDEIISADEGDTSFARSQLAEAEEALDAVQRRIARLVEAADVYHPRARKIYHLTTYHAIKTRQYLRGLADDLKVYLASTQDGLVPGASTSSGPAVSFTTVGCVSGLSALPSPDIKTPNNAPILAASDLNVFRSQQGPLAVEAKSKEYEQRKREYPELGRLTADEYLALNRYSQHDYAPINEAFRLGKTSVLGLWGAHIRLAALALHKLPVFEGVVYRAVADGAFLGNYVPGKKVTEKGFTSASQDYRSSLSFGRVHLEIQSRTGRDIKSCSAMQSAAGREKEVLFSPSTEFEVTGRFEKDGVTVIQMKEV